MRFLFSIALFLFATLAFANEDPQIIPFKTTAIKSIDWYAHQSELWKSKTSSDPQAWINYYIASKYAQKSSVNLHTIALEAEAAKPGSFESLVLRGWDAGYSAEGWDWMNKAYALNAANAITYPSMLLLSEFKLDLGNRKSFSEKMYASGQVSNSLLSYSYNVLMSVEDNAILFTEGENTTIPIFILQDVFNIRKDVHVLNLDMMLVNEYRARKLPEVGIALENFAQFEDELDNKKSFCGMLPIQNQSRKFYYALTVSRSNISEITDQLYVVGLASQLSQQRIDNITFLKENLENRFLLDHLTVDFDGEADDAAGKVLSANYLVPMLLLTEHYKQTGETEKLKRWQTLVEKLGTEHGKSTLVQNFLNREKFHPEPFIAANLNIKALEGSMRHVKDNIHALKNEVTNDDYNFFLKYLQDNNRKDLYEICKYDLSKYTEPALSFMKSYHARPLSKKEKEGYPVVNISYEGAVAYCDWLTEQYNNDEKRKYKKVKFRLPTVQEFQVAALGYKKIQSWVLDENNIEVIVQNNETEGLCKGCPTRIVSIKESGILYPWFKIYNYRDKPVNQFGCALGNFKFKDTDKPCRPEATTPDGFMMMSFVEAYFPNEMGLSDMVGNVAEMTSEKGKATGGSWNHPPEESTIRSINEYSGPDAAIGFRVFMEVIEP